MLEKSNAEKGECLNSRMEEFRHYFIGDADLEPSPIVTIRQPLSTEPIAGKGCGGPVGNVAAVGYDIG
jgi:hypothetical protein